MLSLDIVVAGWALPGLEGEFYPEDLPRDWRLTYFANEFSSVMVPSKRWLEADASLLKTWSENVQDGFRFYLETPDLRIDLESLDLAWHTLGAKLAGLVIENGVQTPPPGQIACFQLLGGPGAIPAPGCLPAWRIPAAAIGDLQAGRDWLHGLTAQAPGSRALLLLEGEDINGEDLRRWWNLAWLMGAADA